MLADPKSVVPGAKPRLVAGLGNPGREYERTRHNVGFLVLDELARRQRVSLVEQRSWKGRHARTERGTHLLQPLTFMNMSGEAVGSLARFHKIPAHEVLVVSDDTALPLGRLRLRLGGSDGGHNGLRSISDHLDTTDFPRLRVGVGSAAPGEQISHVLGGFRPDEQEALQASITRAADAVETAVEHGIEKAMNRFNRPPEQPKAPKPPKAEPPASTTEAAA